MAALFASALADGEGCFLLPGGSLPPRTSSMRLINEKVDGSSSSRNVRMDRALGHILAGIASRFEVHPGFGFYDDKDNPNAFATAVNLIEGAKGSVFFGKHLLQKQLEQSQTSVVGVCAHEFAHILQYSDGNYFRLIEDQATVRRLELHADYLAGFYLAFHRSDYAYNELRDLAFAWKAMGDCGFNNPKHHGTAEERLQAIEAGFGLARNRPEFTIAGVAEVAARWVEAH